MIHFAIDMAGFDGKLLCGTINYFDGWVIETDHDKKIERVSFSINNTPIADLPIGRERPDLPVAFKNARLGFSGFSGIVHIPKSSVGNTLLLEAVSSDGSRCKMKEYLLNETISPSDVEYRRTHNLPDRLLMYQVTSDLNPETFLRHGRADAELIKKLITDNGSHISSLRDILDFGVGCGRVFRWWEEYASISNFYGTDVNPDLIRWCKGNLRFGQFAVNHPQPPTVYSDAKFDLIYVFSVFTHLLVETQRRWLREFRRILATGGYLLVSTHGDSYARKVPWIYESFKNRGYVVMNANSEGQNLCATFQSETFSKSLFGQHFHVMDYVPKSVGFSKQDLYVLSKK